MRIYRSEYFSLRSLLYWLPPDKQWIKERVRELGKEYGRRHYAQKQPALKTSTTTEQGFEDGGLMSKPIITYILGGYSLVWESEQIKINVSRIRETKVSTMAEILITCTSPGIAPHIKQTTFSLTANDARPKLAKELEKIYKAEWDIILEQLCVKVLAEIRRGEPVVVLGQDGTKAEPPEYLVDPYIIRNQPNVFFGEPGAAKSTWGLYWLALLP